ncbi:MAG: hypothetical protein ACRYGP_26110 [Janthinobacterium lividum]
MRALGYSTSTAALAGSMLVGSVGMAFAGADDGGAEALFDNAGPGSARGMVDPQPATPDATNAAASSQPNARVSRTGVAQAWERRPQVSVTRMGQNSSGSPLHRTPVRVARHDGPRATVTAAGAYRLQPVRHAMHRGSVGEIHRS